MSANIGFVTLPRWNVTLRCFVADLAVFTHFNRNYNVCDTLLANCKFEILGCLTNCFDTFYHRYRVCDTLVVECNFELLGTLTGCFWNILTAGLGFATFCWWSVILRFWVAQLAVLTRFNGKYKVFDTLLVKCIFEVWGCSTSCFDTF